MTDPLFLFMIAAGLGFAGGTCFGYIFACRNRGGR